MNDDCQTLELLLRLTLTGGRLTIGPAPHSSRSHHLIELQLHLPEWGGGCEQFVRIVSQEELQADGNNLLSRELHALLSEVAADRFLIGLP
jgi:hypothetical protein